MEVSRAVVFPSVKWKWWSPSHRIVVGIKRDNSFKVTKQAQAHSQHLGRYHHHHHHHHHRHYLKGLLFSGNCQIYLSSWVDVIVSQFWKCGPWTSGSLKAPFRGSVKSKPLALSLQDVVSTFQCVDIGWGCGAELNYQLLSPRRGYGTRLNQASSHSPLAATVRTHKVQFYLSTFLMKQYKSLILVNHNPGVHF